MNEGEGWKDCPKCDQFSPCDRHAKELTAAPGGTREALERWVSEHLYYELGVEAGTADVHASTIMDHFAMTLTPQESGAPELSPHAPGCNFPPDHRGFCIELPSGGKTVPDRINEFTARMTEVYWRELRSAFPEATTDLPVRGWEKEALEDGLQVAAWDWAGKNVQDADWGPVDEEDFEPEGAD